MTIIVRLRRIDKAKRKIPYICRMLRVEAHFILCYIKHKERYLRQQIPLSTACIPFQKWILPSRVLLFRASPNLGGQVRHFYFFLVFLLLSRKVRNATIKLPKEIINPTIPMNIRIIFAIIMVTHLPSYVFQRAGISSGGYHPCHGFRNLILSH